MSTQKHSAIYVRVSTAGQDHASQLPDLERWAKSADGPVVWYKDTASGRTMARTGWDKLMEAVRSGRVSRVICWRLDRLGRTAKGLTALFEDLIARKVNLTSLRDGVDLNTSAGRLMANVLASVAQYETEIRAERVRAGQAVARARGKRWGGSQPGRLLKVTPDQVTAILDMVNRGMKITRIARSVGLSRKTIYRVLEYRRPHPEQATA